MNFKPTLWKSIVSVIIGFLGNVYLFRVRAVCTEVQIAAGDFNCPQRLWYEHILNPIPILFWIISSILIYIIWSYFEKKK